MSAKQIRIRRAPHDTENPYYLVRRDTAQDKSLTYEALGMLNYILSKSDDWVVQPADLQREGCKRNRVYKLLNELISHKYIERIINRDERHRVTAVEYITHEQPYEKPLTRLQEVETQDVEVPEVETRHITKYREEENTDIAPNVIPLDDDTPPPATPAGKRRVTKVSPWYDALVEVFDVPYENLTPSAKKTYGTAAAELYSINFPIRRMAELYRWCESQKWSNFTPMALAKHAPQWLKDHPERKTGDYIPVEERKSATDGVRWVS